jgi:hypothetical protein
VSGTLRLTTLATGDLLKLSVDILEELRDRDIVRSANNPTGDYAEYLFCRAFGWTQEPNSKAGYDAIDARGNRIQIKARRPHRRNPSRQLSGIRNIEARPFDLLAGILFAEDFTVARAALVPFDLVRAHARRSDHTNSALFYLRDDVWTWDGVRDVTETLRWAE